MKKKKKKKNSWVSQCWWILREPLSTESSFINKSNKLEKLINMKTEKAENTLWTMKNVKKNITKHTK